MKLRHKIKSTIHIKIILGKNVPSQTIHIEVFVQHLLKLGSKLMTHEKNNTHIEIIVKRMLAED